MVNYSARLKPPEKVAIALSAIKMKPYGLRKVPAVVIKDLAQKYGTSARTIERIVHAAGIHEAVIPNEINFESITKNSGRKSKLSDDIRQAISIIIQSCANDHVNCTNRRLKAELRDRGYEVSLSTIHAWKKQMEVKTITQRVKPSLTDDHKRARRQFVLNQRNHRYGAEGVNGHQYFLDMLDCVHVDESWFWVRETCQKLTVLPDTDLPPVPTVQHKKHITKVMFLTAMARPRRLPDGNWFDGKIGMWPCIQVEAARRGSRNRPRGAPVSKPRNLNSEYYQELMCMNGGVIAKYSTSLTDE